MFESCASQSAIKKTNELRNGISDSGMNYSGGCHEAPSVACRDNAAPRGLRRALLAPPQTSTVGRHTGLQYLAQQSFEQ
jgi:hypothetical protein